MFGVASCLLGLAALIRASAKKSSANAQVILALTELIKALKNRD